MRRLVEVVVEAPQEVRQSRRRPRLRPGVALRRPGDATCRLPGVAHRHDQIGRSVTTPSAPQSKRRLDVVGTIDGPHLGHAALAVHLSKEGRRGDAQPAGDLGHLQRGKGRPAEARPAQRANAGAAPAPRAGTRWSSGRGRRRVSPAGPAGGTSRRRLGRRPRRAAPRRQPSAPARRCRPSPRR